MSCRTGATARVVERNCKTKVYNKMGVFNTQKTLTCPPSLIPAMADAISKNFKNEGYDVLLESSDAGSAVLSMTKGGVFKAVLGMKTALKVKLIPQDGAVNFDAGIGIWGQQAIPTFIMMFVAWPVILTQVWGMVQQSNLDDEALAVAESVVAAYNNSLAEGNPAHSSAQYCPKCGAKNPAAAKFCNECGERL